MRIEIIDYTDRNITHDTLITFINSLSIFKTKFDDIDEMILHIEGYIETDCLIEDNNLDRNYTFVDRQQNVLMYFDLMDGDLSVIIHNIKAVHKITYIVEKICYMVDGDVYDDSNAISILNNCTSREINKSLKVLKKYD